MPTASSASLQAAAATCEALATYTGSEAQCEYVKQAVHLLSQPEIAELGQPHQWLAGFLKAAKSCSEAGAQLSNYALQSYTVSLAACAATGSAELLDSAQTLQLLTQCVRLAEAQLKPRSADNADVATSQAFWAAATAAVAAHLDVRSAATWSQASGEPTPAVLTEEAASLTSTIWAIVGELGQQRMQAPSIAFLCALGLLSGAVHVSRAATSAELSEEVQQSASLLQHGEIVSRACQALQDAAYLAPSGDVLAVYASFGDLASAPELSGLATDMLTRAVLDGPVDMPVRGALAAAWAEELAWGLSLVCIARGPLAAIPDATGIAPALATTLGRLWLEHPSAALAAWQARSAEDPLAWPWQGILSGAARCAPGNAEPLALLAAALANASAELAEDITALLLGVPSAEGNPLTFHVPVHGQVSLYSADNSALAVPISGSQLAAGSQLLLKGPVAHPETGMVLQTGCIGSVLYVAQGRAAVSWTVPALRNGGAYPSHWAATVSRVVVAAQCVAARGAFALAPETLASARASLLLLAVILGAAHDPLAWADTVAQAHSLAMLHSAVAAAPAGRPDVPADLSGVQLLHGLGAACICMLAGLCQARECSCPIAVQPTLAALHRAGEAYQPEQLGLPAALGDLQALAAAASLCLAQVHGALNATALPHLLSPAAQGLHMGLPDPLQFVLSSAAPFCAVSWSPYHTAELLAALTQVQAAAGSSLSLACACALRAWCASARAAGLRVRIEAVWKTLDADGSGEVDVDELRATLEQTGAGAAPSTAALLRMLAELDGDGSNTVSKAELVYFVSTALAAWQLPTDSSAATALKRQLQHAVAEDTPTKRLLVACVEAAAGWCHTASSLGGGASMWLSAAASQALADLLATSQHLGMPGAAQQRLRAALKLSLAHVQRSASVRAHGHLLAAVTSTVLRTVPEAAAECARVAPELHQGQRGAARSLLAAVLAFPSLQLTIAQAASRAWEQGWSAVLRALQGMPTADSGGLYSAVRQHLGAAPPQVVSDLVAAVHSSPTEPARARVLSTMLSAALGTSMRHAALAGFLLTPASRSTGSVPFAQAITRMRGMDDLTPGSLLHALHQVACTAQHPLQAWALRMLAMVLSVARMVAASAAEWAPVRAAAALLLLDPELAAAAASACDASRVPSHAPDTSSWEDTSSWTTLQASAAAGLAFLTAAVQARHAWQPALMRAGIDTVPALEQLLDWLCALQAPTGEPVAEWASERWLDGHVSQPSLPTLWLCSAVLKARITAGQLTCAAEVHPRALQGLTDDAARCAAALALHEPAGNVQQHLEDLHREALRWVAAADVQASCVHAACVSASQASRAFEEADGAEQYARRCMAASSAALLYSVTSQQALHVLAAAAAPPPRMHMPVAKCAVAACNKLHAMLSGSSASAIDVEAACVARAASALMHLVLCSPAASAEAQPASRAAGAQRHVRFPDQSQSPHPNDVDAAQDSDLGTNDLAAVTALDLAATEAVLARVAEAHDELLQATASSPASLALHAALDSVNELHLRLVRHARRFVLISASEEASGAAEHAGRSVGRHSTSVSATHSAVISAASEGGQASARVRAMVAKSLPVLLRACKAASALCRAADTPPMLPATTDFKRRRGTRQLLQPLPRGRVTARWSAAATAAACAMILASPEVAVSAAAGAGVAQAAIIVAEAALAESQAVIVAWAAWWQHQGRAELARQRAGAQHEHQLSTHAAVHLDSETQLWQQESLARAEAAVQLLTAMALRGSGAVLVVMAGLSRLLSNSAWQHAEHVLRERVAAGAEGNVQYVGNVRAQVQVGAACHDDWAGLGWGFGPALFRGYDDRARPCAAQGVWRACVRLVTVVLRSLNEAVEEEAAARAAAGGDHIGLLHEASSSAAGGSLARQLSAAPEVIAQLRAVPSLAASAGDAHAGSMPGAPAFVSSRSVMPRTASAASVVPAAAAAAAPSALALLQWATAVADGFLGHHAYLLTTALSGRVLTMRALDEMRDVATLVAAASCPSVHAVRARREFVPALPDATVEAALLSLRAAAAMAARDVSLLLGDGAADAAGVGNARRAAAAGAATSVVCVSSTRNTLHALVSQNSVLRVLPVVMGRRPEKLLDARADLHTPWASGADGYLEAPSEVGDAALWPVKDSGMAQRRYLAERFGIRVRPVSAAEQRLALQRVAMRDGAPDAALAGAVAQGEGLADTATEFDVKVQSALLQLAPLLLAASAPSTTGLSAGAGDAPALLPSLAFSATSGLAWSRMMRAPAPASSAGGAPPALLPQDGILARLLSTAPAFSAAPDAEAATLAISRVHAARTGQLRAKPSAAVTALMRWGSCRPAGADDVVGTDDAWVFMPPNLGHLLSLLRYCLAVAERCGGISLPSARAVGGSEAFTMAGSLLSSRATQSPLARMASRDTRTALLALSPLDASLQAAAQRALLALVCIVDETLLGAQPGDGPQRDAVDLMFAIAAVLGDGGIHLDTLAASVNAEALRAASPLAQGTSQELGRTGIAAQSGIYSAEHPPTVFVPASGTSHAPISGGTHHPGGARSSSRERSLSARRSTSRSASGHSREEPAPYHWAADPALAGARPPSHSTASLRPWKDPGNRGSSIEAGHVQVCVAWQKRTQALGHLIGDGPWAVLMVRYMMELCRWSSVLEAQVTD